MNAPKRSDKTKPTGFRHLTDHGRRRFFEVAERMYKARNPEELKKLTTVLAGILGISSTL